jgi:peptidyl-prolyl cis-trans isomerase SurA
LSSEGKLTANQIAPEMRKVIEAMPIGQASQPIVQKNGVGAHHGAARRPAAPAAQPRRCRRTILRQRFDTLARRYLRDLRRTAYVDVRA